MIPDGYNKVWLSDLMTVVYRPLPFKLRQELKQLLQAVPGPYGMQLLQEQVAQCIQKWSWQAPPSAQELAQLRDYNSQFFEDLTKQVLGVGTHLIEQQEAANLAHGVRLTLLYPHLGKLSCGDCSKWWVDPLSGEYAEVNGQRLERSGPLLCQTQEGCPAGTPTRDRRLSRKNQLAYEHYLECQATGNFPDDPWVYKNARIIKATTDKVLQECERRKQSGN